MLLLQVDYPEVQMMKPGAGIAGRSQPPSYSQLHHNAGKTSTASSGREQAPPQPDHAPRHNRYVVTQNDISQVQPALHNQVYQRHYTGSHSNISRFSTNFH